MNTTIAKIPLRQVATVSQLFENQEAMLKLRGVAASHLNAERMMRLVAGAIRTTPDLGKADPMTLLGAVMTCASLGLEPNTILGHAYLIPFKNGRKSKAQGRDVYEIQVIVGYKGFIDLARRSGHITSIDAGVHYSDDDLWDYERGTDARLRHIPGPQDGEKRHAYAIAKFKDGGHAFNVLPWSHVMRIRDASQGYQRAVRFGKTDTPWIAHEDAMAAKTAIRSLVKFLPLSIEFQRAVAVDEHHKDFAAFAMDPIGNDPIDRIEGEAEEAVIEADAEAEAPAVEQKTETAKPAQTNEASTALAEAREKAKAAAAAGKAKPRTDATPYAERGKAAEPAKEPEPDPKANWSRDWAAEAEQARNSMLDLSPERASEVLDMLHLDEIESWKSEDPDGWAALMQDISAREQQAE